MTAGSARKRGSAQRYNSHAADWVRLKVLISESSVGRLIGKSGTRIKSLSKSTGARVRMVSRSEGESLFYVPLHCFMSESSSQFDSLPPNICDSL